MRRLILGLTLMLFCGAAAAQGLGAQQTAATPAPPKPAAKPTAKKTPAQQIADRARIVRRRARPRPARRPLDRRLCQRLPRRGRVAADQRAGLAGDAALAQPQLGQSAPARLSRAAGERCARARRLARASRRRHVAAARRADADRPYQPPDRARRRYLAHADARPHPDAARARGHDRGLDAQGPVQRRSRYLHPGASEAHQARRLLSAGRAHLRASGHQEGAVPDGSPGRQGHVLARQGAGHGGTTTTISIFGSPARPVRKAARIRSRPQGTMAAARS